MRLANCAIISLARKRCRCPFCMLPGVILQYSIYISVALDAKIVSVSVHRYNNLQSDSTIQRRARNPNSIREIPIGCLFVFMRCGFVSAFFSSSVSLLLSQSAMSSPDYYYYFYLFFSLSRLVCVVAKKTHTTMSRLCVCAFFALSLSQCAYAHINLQGVVAGAHFTRSRAKGACVNWSVRADFVVVLQKQKKRLPNNSTHRT